MTAPGADAENDAYGAAMAIDGNYAIVGASWEGATIGAAYFKYIK